MAAPQQQEDLFQEGRVQLGARAYKLGQITTLRGIERTYDVPRNTIKRRISGIKLKRDSIPKNRLLTPVQEEALKQWILSMDQRGMPPRIATVGEMGAILAAQNAPSATLQSVGKNWARKFINRHDSLKTQFNHKYDY